ncbi:hypothetical protein ILYODFUR_025091 [Ilyodon furcidens]|uniref:Uncharacterized protein n=1 Tax=Ilyodon furcidens TaxID=33524 RepID=A0ABV0TXH2_9TELE
MNLLSFWSPISSAADLQGVAADPLAIAADIQGSLPISRVPAVPAWLTRAPPWFQVARAPQPSSCSPGHPSEQSIHDLWVARLNSVFFWFTLHFHLYLSSLVVIVYRWFLVVDILCCSVMPGSATLCIGLILDPYVLGLPVSFRTFHVCLDL